jgi:VIT1/CCC1 family predicted Fe2+/Mn2+ transporter
VPWKHGITNFTSFLLCGLIPLIAFIGYIFITKYTNWIKVGKGNQQNELLIVSIVISLVTLFAMGIFKAY